MACSDYDDGFVLNNPKVTIEINEEKIKENIKENEYFEENAEITVETCDIKRWDHPATKNMLFYRTGKIIFEDTGKKYTIPKSSIIHRNGHNIKNAHVIIAHMFIPNPYKLPFVSHIGSLYEHSITNLKWSNTNLDKLDLKNPPIRSSGDFPESKRDAAGKEFKFHPCCIKWRVYRDGIFIDNKTDKLKPESMGDYVGVSCTFNTKHFTWNASRVVMELWGDTKKPGDTSDGRYVIDHIDNNKKNNNIDNLQWISERENIIKATKVKWTSKKRTHIVVEPSGNFNIKFHIKGKNYSFGCHDKFEDAERICEFVEKLLSEGNVKEVLEYHALNCRTCGRDDIFRAKQILKWTTLRTELTSGEKWHDDYPRYFVKNGNIYNIETSEKMTPGLKNNAFHEYAKYFVTLVNKYWSKDRISVATYMALVAYDTKPIGYHIDHKNNDSKINDFENLEYISPKENMERRTATQKRKREEIEENR